MFDPTTTALLRAVLDEVCEDVFRFESGTRAHVRPGSSKPSRTLTLRRDRFKQIGREALHDASTMLR